MSMRDYRADIDGLRAVAVSAVVIYHALPNLLPAGFVGVDIFFVISGYLIGGIIYSGIIEGKFSFADFYARRARRILPALIVVITATLLVGLLLLDSLQFKGLSTQSIAALVGVSNFYFWEHTNYFDTASELQPLLMTWSLGVEEQFYVIFPFIVIAITKIPTKFRVAFMVALTMASFGYMLFSAQRDPVSTFYLLPARAWELGIGATLAIANRDMNLPAIATSLRNLLAVLGASLIAISILAFDHSAEFPLLPILISVIGTAILMQTRHSWINRNLLSIKAVVFIGLISYSWYLWHWPIMAYIRIVADGVPSQSAMLLAVPISFALAILSWRFVEQPFRKPRATAPRTLMIAGGVLAAAMVLPFAGHVSKGLPDRLPDGVLIAEQIRLEGRGNCLLGFDQSAPSTSQQCAPTGAKIGLIGDSHASALGPGLAAYAKDNGTSLVQHMKSSCGPYLGFSYSGVPNPNSIRTCGAFVENALEKLLQDPDIETIVVAAYWPKDVSETAYTHDGTTLGPAVKMETFLDSGMSRLIEQTQNAGKKLIFVEDIPIFESDTMSRTIGDGLRARRALRTLVTDAHGSGTEAQPRARADTDVSRAETLLRQLAETHSNVTYFQVRHQFCEDSACRYMQEGKPLFFDRHHLSVYGSSFVDWASAFSTD